MWKPDSNTPTALNAAVAAWNDKAQKSASPVLGHIFTTIRNLQRLRSAIRIYGDLDPATLAAACENQGDDSAKNSVENLRELCARLDDFESTLAQLSELALTVSQQGEALIEDYLALPPGSSGEVPDQGFQLHLAHWAESGAERREKSDMRALDRLIEAQNAEIDALNQQLAEAERLLAPPVQTLQPELPRTCGQIELQSVRDFVQNSSIAPIPVNASYFDSMKEAASSPEGHKVPMGKILTRAGVVSDRQLESALDYQREGRRQALGSLLVDLGYTTEAAIAQALAAQLAIPYVVLANEPTDPAAITTIPIQLARRHMAFPLSFNGHGLYVAMANPLDLIALEDLRIASSMHIRPCVAARGEIASHIERFFV